MSCQRTCIEIDEFPHADVEGLLTWLFGLSHMWLRQGLSSCEARRRLTVLDEMAFPTPVNQPRHGPIWYNDVAILFRTHGHKNNRSA
jgi:hypothetical protein